MRDSDFKRKLFWGCIDNLGSKGSSSAAKLAEPALYIPQHSQPEICPPCKGDGYIDIDGGAGGDDICRTCNGTGKLQA